jgi:hypothetical protein
VPIKRAAVKKKTAPKKTAGVKTAPKKNKAAPKKRTGAKARAKAMKKILRNVEKKMSEETMRATLGDYIRLYQLEQEMGNEPKPEIKVMWIERDPSSPTEE